MQPIGTHGGEVMYFGCVSFRGELSFLNCDDICMCVVNKQFELLEFVFDSVYGDLQYDLFLFVLSLCRCLPIKNMGGTRGSGVLSSADDVLEMSVVRGVCGVCDMCMCRDGV